MFFLGEGFYEGFLLLQRIYKKNAVNIPLTIDWLIKTVILKESSHSPFSYCLNIPNIYTRENETDPYVKELQRSSNFLN